MDEIVVGAPCSVSGKDEFGTGIVRFYGETKFKEGLWVGIEFPNPIGKNNGTVAGVAYFSCPTNHGMFVPSNLVKMIAKPSPVASPVAAAPVSAPASAKVAATSPSSSSSSVPIKKASGASTPVAAKPSKAESSSSSSPAPTPAPTPAPVAEVDPLLVSAKALQAQVDQLSESVTTLEAWKRNAQEQIRGLQKEVAEKEAQLEKKQHDLDENVKAMAKEKAQLEKQHAKEIEKINKENASKVQKMQESIDELTDKLEEEKIDREIDEERIRELEQSLHSVEGELEILKSQHERSGDASSSSDEMQQQNERLKVALMKLRDLSLVEKQESAKKIKELEKENQVIPQLEEKNLKLETDLLQAEENVEELREQLDAALEAEDMVEELSQRNLDNEQIIAELKKQIVDLEDTIEISEQLEEQQQEEEKKLRSQINIKEIQILDLEGNIHNIQQQNKGKDQLLEQFRTKIKQLEQRLFEFSENVTSQSSVTEHLSTQSQKLSEDNIQLRAQLDKLTSASIQQELRAIEASYSIQKFGMIKTFLPHDWKKEEMEAVDCQLLLAQLQKKCALISSQIKPDFQLHDFSITISSAQQIEDRLFGSKLVGVVEVIEKIIASIQQKVQETRDVKTWVQLRKVQWEMAFVDRSLDHTIELLKQHELHHAPSPGSPSSAILTDLTGVVRHLQQLRGKFLGPMGRDEIQEKTYQIANEVQQILLTGAILQRILSVNLSALPKTFAQEVCRTEELKDEAKKVLDLCRRINKIVAKNKTKAASHDHASLLLSPISSYSLLTSEISQVLSFIVEELDARFAPGSSASPPSDEALSKALLSRLFLDALQHVRQQSPSSSSSSSSSSPSSDLSEAAISNESPAADEDLGAYLLRNFTELVESLSTSESIARELLEEAAVEESHESSSHGPVALQQVAQEAREEIASVSKMRERIDRLEENVRQQVNLVSKKEYELSDAQAKHDLLKAKIDQLKNRIKDLDELIQSINEENSRQTKTWESALVTLQEEINSLESQNKELKEKVAEAVAAKSSSPFSFSSSSSNLLDHSSSSSFDASSLANASLPVIVKEIADLRSTIRHLRSLLAKSTSRSLVDSSLPPLNLSSTSTSRPSRPSSQTKKEREGAKECKEELQVLLKEIRGVAGSPRVVDISKANGKDVERSTVSSLKIDLIRKKKQEIVDRLPLTLSDLPALDLSNNSSPRLVGRVSFPSSSTQSTSSSSSSSSVVSQSSRSHSRVLLNGPLDFQRVHAVFSLSG